MHPLSAQLQAHLVAFRDAEQPDLAQEMKPKTITVIADEHFHSGKPCLVGLEPVSGFILVETYRDHRDADTWKATIQADTQGMPVDVIQMTTDQAAALICCAEKGFEAAHSPDLFHLQRDLLQPLILPLSRPIQQTKKELEKIEQRLEALDGPAPGRRDGPMSVETLLVLVEEVKKERAISQQGEEAKERKDAAVDQVRGIGNDYHPFDRQTGKPVSAEEVGKRLEGYVDKLEEVVQEAGLGGKAQGAVTRSRKWIVTLVGCIAWFWSQAGPRVAALELSEEEERLVREKLLPGYYWEEAAGRARTAEERKRLKELSEKLKEEAWEEGGALGSMPEARREEVKAVAVESAGLFQRSSSSVEGRNGRLSLQHHGHSRVSEGRLKALTVIHNYLVKRPGRRDGETTAAERFFGQKHKDLFAWLLERMPDLPRPAAKRPKKVG